MVSSVKTDQAAENGPASHLVRGELGCLDAPLGPAYRSRRVAGFRKLRRVLPQQRPVFWIELGTEHDEGDGWVRG